MLDVPYSEQLAIKDDSIIESFSALIDSGKLDKGAIAKILGAEDPYHYRDKVTSPFVPPRKVYRGAGSGGRNAKGRNAAAFTKHRNPKGRNQGKRNRNKSEVVTGIYAQGTHSVVPVDECLIENPVASKVVRAIKQIMEKHGVDPYDEDTGRGFMRHAVVRVGHKSGEVLVTLVTNSEDFPHSKSFCKELISKVPECTSIVQNVNTRQTNVILGEDFRRLYGPGFILDELCGMSFRISPGAFYQVNSTQTEKLYEQAVELADINPDDAIIDAYCGTGTIGLVAARRHGNALLGVDSSAESISDARMNAKHNGVENAEFVAADATEHMRELAAGKNVPAVFNGAVPDNLVLFIDPPRSGASKEFLDSVSALRPEKVVYISCNPNTQARDCEILCDAGYSIRAVQPVDMFPHTSHVESIVLLESAVPSQELHESAIQES